VSIGEALADVRRRAGLTVAQVSDRTGIRETVITGIEGDDYSACGGDLYVRGYIRSIARAIGADPQPLIRQYEAAQLGPPAMPDEADEPVTPASMHERRLLYWIALPTLTLGVLGVYFAAFHFLAGWPPATNAASPARAPAVAHHPGHSKQATTAAAPTTATPDAAAARTLTPVSAAAFSPSGAGQGDNPALAPLATDANPTTAWHTDWYANAHLGNLYPGTGLLVDLGRPVTITAAQLTLGTARGASFQLRVGAAPALADLPPVAHAANTGGVVRLRLITPAHGRYLLIWFTSLPPDPAGTFQASVYNIRLEGRS
jgi:cytoskeletal protein RodZ